ncbi:MAG: glutathione S-transferase [Bradyrhizobium sp.]
MLTVHHLNNSRSQRVLWLLEELGVAYDIVRYQRQSNMLAPPELRAIHPLGKSPVITDGGKTIAESGAIAEYLVGTYGDGRLIPSPDTPERLRYTYWLHYAEGSAMPPLLLKLLFTLMPKRAPALLRPLVRKVSNQAMTALVNPQLKLHMAFWERELSKSEWFAGDAFTAADIQMSFPLEAAAARGGLEQGHPKAMVFLERIHARPAYQRALERGGPYAVGR